MISITPIPAFNDNYLWLLDNGQQAIIVDPGDAVPVESYLKANGLSLSAILVTHHHGDHIGGVQQLKQKFNCPVYGPAQERIASLDFRLSEGDEVYIEQLGLRFSVIDVPGHTAGHIAYFCAKTDNHDNLLFCGDTVFSGGCGRLFEGTAAQMWTSMQKLMKLPDETLVYPAHEYTLANLDFALSVEPQNTVLQEYQRQVVQLRNQNTPSLPSKIGVEKSINPFMRVREPNLVATVESRTGQQNLAESEVFAQIRAWKDNF